MECLLSAFLLTPIPTVPAPLHLQKAVLDNLTHSLSLNINILIFTERYPDLTLITISPYSFTALRALTKPFKFDILPRRARPVPRLMECYLGKLCKYLNWRLISVLVVDGWMSFINCCLFYHDVPHCALMCGSMSVHLILVTLSLVHWDFYWGSLISESSFLGKRLCICLTHFHDDTLTLTPTSPCTTLHYTIRLH